jgi:hypothetical protein
MHKLIAACLLSIICFAAFAQDEPQSNSSASSNITSKFTTTFNVYTNQWIDAPRGITVTPVSPSCGFNILYKVPLYKPYVTLMFGPGIAYTDYRTNGYPVSTADGDSTYFIQLQPNEYRTNKMSILYVEVPVEIEFALPSKKGKQPWYLAPGFTTGLRVSDFMKTTGEDSNGDPIKQKIYYTRNLSDIHYGPSVRIGKGWFGLYGYYGLAQLFDDGKGPSMTVYRAGITLGGF